MGVLGTLKGKIVQVKNEIIQVIKPHKPITRENLPTYNESKQKLVFGSTSDRYYKVFKISGKNGEVRFATTTTNKKDLTDKEVEKIGRALNSKSNYKNNSDPIPFKSAQCTYCYDRATGKTLWGGKHGGKN